MTDIGYTLMHSVVHGNVLGAVIAPKGTEHYPKDRRMLVWRVMIRPLVEEVAEHEEFPQDDAKEVAMELFDFCVQEGLVFSLDREEEKER
jgi:hypothetical protein